MDERAIACKIILKSTIFINYHYNQIDSILPDYNCMVTLLYKPRGVPICEKPFILEIFHV
jgi:hypothetical protein